MLKAVKKKTWQVNLSISLLQYSFAVFPFGGGPMSRIAYARSGAGAANQRCTYTNHIQFGTLIPSKVPLAKFPELSKLTTNSVMPYKL